MSHACGIVLAITLLGGACIPVGQADSASPLPGEWVPGPGDKYVRNPAVTLKREYWLVAKHSAGTHYMIPRPDGAAAIVAECQAGGPQSALFRGAMLCEAATSPSQVARVNALSADEAMQISSFLHARLRFRSDAGMGHFIEPPPHLRDVLDTCKQRADLRNGVLKARCDRELGFEKGGARPDIAHPFTADETAALVPVLNELYGIS